MASILIVDDSPTIRHMVVEALEEFEVLEAENGRIGIEVLTSSPQVELIICDINMPEMGGLEMLRQLKSTIAERDLRVVVLSTEGDPRLVAQARSLGASGWVLKPFEPGHLLAATRKLLQSRCDAHAS